VGKALAIGTFILLVLVIKCKFDRYEQARSRQAAQQQPVDELDVVPPSTEGQGWESEEEIARKIAAIMGKRAPGKKEIDRSFIRVKKDGTADLRKVTDALKIVNPGGTVEICDSETYEQRFFPTSDSKLTDYIVRKRGITLRGAPGETPRLVQPSAARKVTGPGAAILYAGPDWKIENLALVGKDKILHGIVWCGGNLEIRFCKFSGFKNVINQGDSAERLLIHDCVFSSNGSVVALDQTSERLSIETNHNLVYNCDTFVSFPPSAKGVLKELGLILNNNIFLDVGNVLFAEFVPAQIQIQSDYNSRCRTDEKISDKNLLAKALARMIEEKTAEVHSLTGDPKVRTDFHLADNSPCLGKASDGGNLGVRWERQPGPATMEP